MKILKTCQGLGLTFPFLGQFLRATPNSAWHTGGYATPQLHAYIYVYMTIQCNNSIKKLVHFELKTNIFQGKTTSFLEKNVEALNENRPQTRKKTNGFYMKNMQIVLKTYHYFSKKTIGFSSNKLQSVSEILHNFLKNYLTMSTKNLVDY